VRNTPSSDSLLADRQADDDPKGKNGANQDRRPHFLCSSKALDFDSPAPAFTGPDTSRLIRLVEQTCVYLLVVASDMCPKVTITTAIGAPRSSACVQ